MKRSMKAGVVISLICGFTLFFMSGCISRYQGYVGEYPDLYSVAINSLLGTKGRIVSEDSFSPALEKIETDSYGRVLFCYCEDTANGVYSLLISQKTDGEFVYYYPDYNFLSFPMTDNNYVTIYSSRRESKIELPLNGLNPEDYLELKEKNDWEKPIDEKKCVKVKITTRRTAPKIDKQKLKDLYDTYMGAKNYPYYRTATYFTSDDFGRDIFYVQGVVGYGDTVEDIGTWRSLTILLKPDKSCDEDIGIIEIKEQYSYQDELKAFKERNGWNQAF